VGAAEFVGDREVFVVVLTIVRRGAFGASFSTGTIAAAASAAPPTPATGHVAVALALAALGRIDFCRRSAVGGRQIVAQIIHVVEQIDVVFGVSGVVARDGLGTFALRLVASLAASFVAAASFGVAARGAFALAFAFATRWTLATRFAPAAFVAAGLAGTVAAFLSATALATRAPLSALLLAAGAAFVTAAPLVTRALFAALSARTFVTARARFALGSSRRSLLRRFAAEVFVRRFGGHFRSLSGLTRRCRRRRGRFFFGRRVQAQLQGQGPPVRLGTRLRRGCRLGSRRRRRGRGRCRLLSGLGANFRSQLRGEFIPMGRFVTFRHTDLY
ncbi:MAG: hypothetical protein K1X74_20405, partial [Pirellulales bacterium]|nr:hypothetical protein [Pirellulales bacterium]